jgi:hypothetical protein
MLSCTTTCCEEYDDNPKNEICGAGEDFRRICQSVGLRCETPKTLSQASTEHP